MEISNMYETTSNYNKREKLMQELTEITPIDTYVILKAKEIIDQLVTTKRCPHCGGRLLLSDLKQYDYVCPECDENFYEYEV